MYAMCTGRPPFRAETAYGILRKITDTDPRSIREMNPEIPEWLESIVQRLMGKDKEKRMGMASQLSELLGECLAHVQRPTTNQLPASIGRISSEMNIVEGRTIQNSQAVKPILPIQPRWMGATVVRRSQGM